MGVGGKRKGELLFVVRARLRAPCFVCLIGWLIDWLVDWLVLKMGRRSA
jgi:hypothetical protein